VVLRDLAVHSRHGPSVLLAGLRTLPDGVQATINVRGEDITVERESDKGWSKLRFNFTPAEARQLAAQLVAAADSYDRIEQGDYIMRRLEKIAAHLGADIFGA
jgi:hypothetical protein